jgi:HEAT repeat protein
MTRTLFVVVSCFLLILQSTCSAQPPTTALDRCRTTDFSLEGDKFDKGWQERVALEFEIVNKADLGSLRTGLTDENLYVRALAARALGIRADRKSSDAIAALVQNDPEYLVRVRAVEALGLLKMKSEVIEAAKKDKHGAVRWAADLSADIRKQDVDYAEQLRQAFAEGINRNEMAQAVVGKPAPDFAALTIDGNRFRLSSVLGKRPIVLYFAAFDS